MSDGYEKTGLWNVMFYSHTGFSQILCRAVERQIALRRARTRLKAMRRAGKTIVKVRKGEWEVNGDDGNPVGDNDGFLMVTPHIRRFRRIFGKKVYI